MKYIIGMTIGFIIMAFVIRIIKKDDKLKIDNLHIAMPPDWREITGMDTIQLIVGGKYRYDESKQDFVKVEDSVYANFCYPNTIIPPFLKKKDTVFIHDTVYLKSKHKKEINYDGEPPINSGCDSAAKALNVMYWKSQCESIKHHNEVMPEDSWALPQLSPDSCMVSFPL